MSFTLKYAAPETIRAFRRGDRRFVADPSADVWAFGMICFELLTHQEFYSDSNAHEVVELLDSERLLPTEQALSPQVIGELTSHTCIIWSVYFPPYHFPGATPGAGHSTRVAMPCCSTCNTQVLRRRPPILRTESALFHMRPSMA